MTITCMSHDYNYLVYRQIEDARHKMKELQEMVGMLQGMVGVVKGVVFC